MKKILFSRIFLASLLLSFIVTGITGWATIRRGQTHEFNIENGLQGIKLVSVNKISTTAEGTAVELIFSNTSGKDILAFTLGVKSETTNSRYMVDNFPYTIGKVFAANNTIAQPVHFRDPMSKVKVLGILYADGTTEGIPITTTHLKEQYTGFIKQYQTVNQLIESALQHHPGDDAGQIAEIKQGILNLEESPTGALGSSSEQMGYKHAKSLLVNQITSIENDVQTGKAANYQTGLQKLRDNILKISSK